MQFIVATLRRLNTLQRILLLAVGINLLLILGGIRIVPATVTSFAGVWSLVGALCMQLGIAAIAIFGPVSLQKYPRSIGIIGVLALLFALAYDGVIFLEFAGVNTNANIYALFLGVGFLAGFIVSYHTHRLGEGLLAAIWALVIGTVIWSVGIMIIYYATWGSHQWYLFLLSDGAIADFQQHGGGDLNAFILQDMQGALFFHPVVSVVFGAISGGLGSGIAYGIAALESALRHQPKKDA